MRYRVTCVFRAVSEDGEAVTHLGGVDAAGERWTMSVEEAAEMMSSGEGIFLLEAEPLTGIEPESTRLLRLPSCP
jgi:hypothetical protein